MRITMRIYIVVIWWQLALSTIVYPHHLSNFYVQNRFGMTQTGRKLKTALIMEQCFGTVATCIDGCYYMFVDRGQIMTAAREAEMAMVVDADGLFLVAQNPEIVKGYDKVVLTPNLIEFQRIANALSITIQNLQEERIQKIYEVVGVLDGPVLASKGIVDAICDSNTQVFCDTKGSSRRCGGQGDVLSGSIAVFVAWSLKYAASCAENDSGLMKLKYSPLVVGAFGACYLVRTTAKITFAENKRSMVAGDIIQNLGQNFYRLFDSNKN